MCNPIDAVHHALDALTAQLNQQIDFACDFYGHDEMPFYTALASDNWVNLEPYASMRFEFEWLEGNFAKMCSAFELFFGSTMESEFAAELRKEVKDHVDARLAYWREKRTQELQEQLNAELAASAETLGRRLTA